MSVVKTTALGILFLLAVVAMCFGGRKLKEGQEEGGTGGFGTAIVGVGGMLLSLLCIFIFAFVAVRC